MRRRNPLLACFAVLSRLTHSLWDHCCCCKGFSYYIAESCRDTRECCSVVHIHLVVLPVGPRILIDLGKQTFDRRWNLFRTRSHGMGRATAERRTRTSRATSGAEICYDAPSVPEPGFLYFPSSLLYKFKTTVLMVLKNLLLMTEPFHS